MPSPANLLTDFILRQSYADLPEPIRHQAKRCLLDSMGALSAGAVTPLARLTARTAERFFQGGECTLIASGKKVSPLGASMANGFASNALDVEHGYRPAQGRPGAALTPVMLAAAEMAETPPSGTDMLAAVAVGYEVGMRSGMYWNRDHARVYTSGLWGAIGAVAAAGRILGLTEDVLLQALNCADYHGPVGLIARGVATPCMAKDGVGWGAHTAMMSILLAQAGFTSPLLDFDAALAEELGSRWRMADLYFKPYCCCRWAQASIAGALKIVRENDLAVSDIRRLVIHTFSKAASLSREHPTHTDAAQYNITYPIAVALLDGQISGAQVLPPRIFDKDVLELADMIEVVVEDRFEERFPARTFSEVCITTTDGRELRSGELEPQWEPADSPSDEELLDITSVGRSLPGLMIGNVSYLFGYHVAGFPGALACLLGISLPSLIVLTVVTWCYTQVKDNLYVSRAMTGVRAAVAPVVASAALKLRKAALADRAGYVFLFLAFALYLFGGLSCILIVLISGFLGWLLSVWHCRKGGRS